MHLPLATAHPQPWTPGSFYGEKPVRCLVLRTPTFLSNTMEVVNISPYDSGIKDGISDVWVGSPSGP